MSQKMIAKKPICYDRRDIAAGEEFNARDPDAGILKQAGAADFAEPQERRYRRRDLRAEE